MTNKEAAAILENDLTAIVDGNADFMEAFWRAVDSLKQEPKTGYWINLNKDNEGYCDDNGNPHVKCSECGCFNGTDDSDYCPNCGAKMESEDKK